MKKYVFLILFVVSALRCPAEDELPYSYAAVLFKNNHPETISQGHLSEAAYKKWFVEGPGFATGARVEIPPGSVAFGALYVYSKTSFLTMPFYQAESGNFFLCQSPEYGSPPQFRILEKSEDAFDLSLKLKLKELK